MQAESLGWPPRLQAGLPGDSSGHRPRALGLGGGWGHGLQQVCGFGVLATGSGATLVLDPGGNG